MKSEQPFRLYGIFGFPLGHTLSPVMHEAAFERLGIKAYYLALELPLPDFRHLMKQLPRLIVDGFNITVPFKQTVLPYLDQLTPEARHVGAVNTVFRRGKKWIGTNTDVDGFLMALRNEGKFRPRGRKVLILGAGGAARAVVYGLAREGAAEIKIANRHLNKAEKIIRDFRKIFSKTVFNAILLQDEFLGESLKETDLVVNATSLGLKSSDPVLLRDSLIPKAGRRLLFYDLIYHTRQTAFLEAARKQGHRTLSGLGMLLFQGAQALEYWTRRKAPVGVMRQALLAALKGDRQ